MQRAIRGGRNENVHSEYQPLARLRAISTAAGISATERERRQGPEPVVSCLTTRRALERLRNCRAAGRVTIATAIGRSRGTAARGRPGSLATSI